MGQVPPGGRYDPPGGGYDPPGGNFGGSNWGPWMFSGHGTFKRDSPEKETSNGTLKPKIGDIFSS